MRKHWSQSTFDSVDDSIEYHLSKHGKGRTLNEYTKTAIEFFQKYKDLEKLEKLNEGAEGIKIKIKLKNKDGVNRYIGGYWTKGGKIICTTSEGQLARDVNVSNKNCIMHNKPPSFKRYYRC